MKKRFIVLSLVALCSCFAGGAYAGDITVFDFMDHQLITGSHPTTYAPAVYSKTPINEDQTVTRGATGSFSQGWDLEAMGVKNQGGQKVLQLLGGWDWVNGRDGYTTGDIFFSKDRPNFGHFKDNTGQTVNGGNYNYDFAVVFTRDANNHLLGGYTIYSLTANAKFLTVNGSLPDEAKKFANPWRFDLANSPIGSYSVVTTGNYVLTNGLDDAQAKAALDLSYNIIGGTHNLLEVNIAAIAADLGPNFWAYHTMRCGNDALVGNVPLPSALLLLGAGLGRLLTRKRQQA